jgi:hypothetical protein
LVDDNWYLEAIAQPNLKQVTGSLSITDNSRQLRLSFPQLFSVESVAFSNVESADITALTNVTDNFWFFNSSITNISAPSLINVGGSLSISSCQSLTDLSFSKLKVIVGDFFIANNSELQTIGGFDELNTVGGEINWTGSFDSASLPQISNVGGGINVQSSSDSFRCPFPQIRTNGVVKGKGFICSGNINDPSSSLNGINQTADAFHQPSTTNITSQLPSSSAISGDSTYSGNGLLNMN